MRTRPDHDLIQEEFGPDFMCTINSALGDTIMVTMKKKRRLGPFTWWSKIDQCIPIADTLEEEEIHGQQVLIKSYKRHLEFREYMNND